MKKKEKILLDGKERFDMDFKIVIVEEEKEVE